MLADVLQKKYNASTRLKSYEKYITDAQQQVKDQVRFLYYKHLLDLLTNEPLIFRA